MIILKERDETQVISYYTINDHTLYPYHHRRPYLLWKICTYWKRIFLLRALKIWNKKGVNALQSQTPLVIRKRWKNISSLRRELGRVTKVGAQD